MSNWLMLASWIAVVMLNVADSVQTRTALRKGYHEQNRVTRALIERFGLDRAMLFKTLLPMLLVVPVVLGWNNPAVASAATLLFLIIIILYIYVVLQNCRQLLRPQSAK